MPDIGPQDLTVVGILILIITGLVRGWLYTSSYVDKMNTNHEERIKDKDDQIATLRQDRDFYKSLTLQMLQNNNRAIDIVQKTIEP